LPIVTARAPTLFASNCARRLEARFAREAISLTRCPASRSDTASALPRLPDPTIAILGFHKLFLIIARSITASRGQREINN
jgi:hypothetical protein